MGLVIRIIASPEGESVTDWSVTFPEGGGSIGRVPGVTLQLSDNRRIVSGTHAIISRYQQGYRITDVSTNGLYINGSTRPLGRECHQPLNDGDILDVGEYRLQVSCFSPGQPTLQDPQHSGAVAPCDAIDDPLGKTTDNSQVLTSKSRNTEKSESPYRQSDRHAVTQNNVLGSSLEPDPFTEFDIDQQPSTGIDQNEDRDAIAEAEASFCQAYSKRSLTEFNEPAPLLFDGGKVGPTSHRGAEHQELAFVLGQMQWFEQRNQAREMDLYDCLETAFNQVIEELDPALLAATFDEYAPHSRWWPGRKAFYWRMYCRHFQKSVSSRDLLLKFRGCFDQLYQRKNWQGKG
ncbi:MAG: hypothetical protein B0D91_05295 [Oceanospirillales bacterium LUC14_002_19_P2]|nr:MAG: hypothetical protein B0D91_05295 [Oceanospirillales bacterium LUC14_002_19_P2]